MKTWFAAAAALFAAGDYAGILMPQYFSVYAVLAVVLPCLWQRRQNLSRKLTARPY